MGMRSNIMDRLAEDLVGPYSEDELLEPRLSPQNLILQSRPGDVYLSGILWPQKTKVDPSEDESLGAEGVGDDSDTGSSSEAEQTPFSNMMRPSSAGLSFAAKCDGEFPELAIKVSFGVYVPERFPMKIGDKDVDAKAWRRRHVNIEKTVLVKSTKNLNPYKLKIENLPDGIYLYFKKTPSPVGELISVSLVNGMELEKANREDIEKYTLFQVEIKVSPGKNTRFVARPSRRSGLEVEDQSANLLYRSKLEFATGHTCSATWTKADDGIHATEVATTWLPSSKILDTNPDGHTLFHKLKESAPHPTLSVPWLSTATDDELNKALALLPRAYEEWIELQEQRIPSLSAEHIEAARNNLQACKDINNRMMSGANTIAQSPEIAEAFRLANQAMLTQFRWSKGEDAELFWRPFQLGFILLAVKSTLLDITDDAALDERQTMDLLWFPTGGGKTEAYLGLIAILVFYRRLKHGKAPNEGRGIAAIMRYTLRLLTTQQFARASSLIFACEVIRRNNENRLGTIPFSIGLWVGDSASPNRIKDAVKALAGDKELSSPKQLSSCPACKGKLEWRIDRSVSEIHARCTGKKPCPLRSDAPLPIWTVDEDIYKKHPTLLIGTVDKFAQILRRPETNALFGINRNTPPDLIIQDELHLIGGPLGSMTGLYEALVDKLFECNGIPPKIIGSTATIKRADEQVRGLFNRNTEQFPPPCIDADDSGFAVTKEGSTGRIYQGATTAGRSAKFALQAVSASLLQSAQALSDQTDKLTLDEWWTLVAYFNSLRELGGALVLMQDDVHDAIDTISHRRKENSRMSEVVEELTSRLTQTKVGEMLVDLETTADEDGVLDVVLASNMLSVGVDISRLGLMVVNGQPKGMSEYIQATSRVGRSNVPGLVVSILNNAKARDRSHFESFRTWHQSLYRDVEPASVTPFAPRARDKALHAVLVGLVRHLDPAMLNSPDLKNADPKKLDKFIDYIIARANEVDPEETDILMELKNLIHKWQSRGASEYWHPFKSRISLLQSAEDAAAKRASGNTIGEAWPTPNSMRTVEPSVRFKLIPQAFMKKKEEGQDGQV
ncbi:conserved protein of unknown function [Pseudodesulfovibrio profundus]|uniref:Helicase C-terminal domain-containing protein n=1 Tax=Pseudodesulfovibrio profundus TaxID=57320 RepID=A0A2C8F4E0_9BACT|nr:helicase-related protein [Pseudodesulfovibrio profundus]SOB56965.1 conserved protein of unknown function [Pseudodesulfovibrio profundus]